MTDKQIENCPKCGGESVLGRLTNRYFQHWYFVFCEDCDCETDFMQDENETIEHWNQMARNYKEDET